MWRHSNNMKRNNIKSLIIGNKKKLHIEIVYQKNIFNILSIVLLNNYKSLKYIYDKKI